MSCEPLDGWQFPGWNCEGYPFVSTPYSYWSASGMTLLSTPNPTIPVRKVRCRNNWVLERSVSWHYRWLNAQGLMQEITDTGVFSDASCGIET